jgi:phospholipase/carboxylesterase
MKLAERRIDVGGLSTIAIGDADADTVVVFLHGRSMLAADLAAFAHSLGVPAYYLFPDAPLAATPRGRCWWPRDEAAHASAGAALDRVATDPPGRAAARALLETFCAELPNGRRRVLVGFSQGGMLAMDAVLHGLHVDALVLLSSSRIAFGDWQPRLARLHRLPMLIAHGHTDAELAFAAGEGLRDAALAGGARVTWLPYDGGHEIPLVVWRSLRAFLRELAGLATDTKPTRSARHND